MKRAVTFGVVLTLMLLGDAGPMLNKSHPVSAPNHPVSDSTNSPRRIETTLTLPRGHGPFMKGVKMSLSDAQAAAGFSFLLPEDPVANNTNIRAVYYEVIPSDPEETTRCGRSPIVHAAIDYESGIVIEEELVAGTGCEFDIDPAGTFLRVVDRAGETGSLHTATGEAAPAIFIPEDAEGTAYVGYVHKGVFVNLYPDYASFDLRTLKRVAQTSLLLGLNL